MAYVPTQVKGLLIDNQEVDFSGDHNFLDPQKKSIYNALYSFISNFTEGVKLSRVKVVGAEELEPDRGWEEEVSKRNEEKIKIALKSIFGNSANSEIATLFQDNVALNKAEEQQDRTGYIAQIIENEKKNGIPQEVLEKLESLIRENSAVKSVSWKNLLANDVREVRDVFAANRVSISNMDDFIGGLASTYSGQAKYITEDGSTLESTGRRSGDIIGAIRRTKVKFPDAIMDYLATKE